MWQAEVVMNCGTPAAFTLADSAELAGSPNVRENRRRPKAIVRAAEAVSAYVLHMPSQMDVVPAYQFSKFWRFEQFVSSETVADAAKFWNSLEDDRNKWTQGVYETLV